MTAIQDIPLKTIKGEDTSLADYAGKVVLAVNVASKCGLTPQYEGLEKLYGDYKDKGLVVAGFPANDFGAQEPGTNDEIESFCTTNFGVDFPMFAVQGKCWCGMSCGFSLFVRCTFGPGRRCAAFARACSFGS